MNRERLVLRGVIEDGEAVAGVEHEGERLRRVDLEARDRKVDDAMNPVAIPRCVLLLPIDEVTVRIPELPSTLDEDAAHASEMELRLKPPQSDLVELVAYEPS